MHGSAEFYGAKSDIGEEKEENYGSNGIVLLPAQLAFSAHF